MIRRRRSLLITPAVGAMAMLIACSLLPPPPKNIPLDRWVAHVEGLGTAIQGLAVHPTDPDRIVIQTAGGIYYTTNGAQTPWQRATGVPIATSGTWSVPNVIVMSPVDPTVLYTVVLDGAYRSPDFGATWTNITGAYPDWLNTYLNPPFGCGFLIAGIRPHPSVAGTLFAGTVVSDGEGGVLRSSDDGKTWQRIAFTCDTTCPAPITNAPPPRARLPQEPPKRARPPASARTDQRCAPIGTPLDNDVWPIVIHPSMPDIMVAGGPYAKEAGRSIDGGVTWNRLPAPVMPDDVISTIAVNPTAPENWIISGTSTFRSSDHGATWTHDPSDPLLGEVQCDANGNAWGHDGISVRYLPAGGTQWQRIPFTGEAAIKGLVVRGSAAVPLLFAATEGDGLWVKRGGDPWIQPPLEGVTPVPRLMAIQATREGDGHLLLPRSGRLRVRMRNDTRWRPLGPRPLGGAQDFDFTAGLTEVCYAGAEVACWRPGHAAWTPLPHDLTAASFLAIRYHPTSADRLFAIAGVGLRQHVLLRFSRGAGGFIADAKVPLPDSHVAYRLAVSPALPTSLYLALWDRVIRVDRIDDPQPVWVDLGDFALIDGKFLWLTAIELDPSDPTRVYAVDSDGERLFYKPGAGAWSELTPFTLSQGGQTTMFGVGDLAMDWSAGGRMMVVSGRGGALEESLKIRAATGSPWRAVDDQGVLPRAESIALQFLPWNRNIALLATGEHGIYLRDVGP